MAEHERKRERRRLTRRELEAAAADAGGSLFASERELLLLEAAERLLEMEAASDMVAATTISREVREPQGNYGCDRDELAAFRAAERRLLASRFDDEESSDG